MRKSAMVVILMIVLSLGLAACGSAPDRAGQAVEDYINALVSKDANRLSTLSCADWELNAMLEFDSLQAVETRLEGFSCATSGTEGDVTLVACQGKLLATYNNEDQEIDLSVRTYQVVQQGGEFLVCGYR